MVTQLYASYKTDRSPRVKCDTHLLRHVVAQKLMLDENSGWVKLGRDAFVIPRTTSAAFLSQCTNIVWLLLTENPPKMMTFGELVESIFLSLFWLRLLNSISVYHYPQRSAGSAGNGGEVLWKNIRLPEVE